MPYELSPGLAGTKSLKHTESGQVMHSHIGPWEEANLVYIEQSRLCERMAAGESLRIYDVGMGIAANALAAIEVAAATPQGKLEIHSFENDLAGIHTALKHREQFPFLDRHFDPVETLVTKRIWTHANIQWHLHEGDFFVEVQQCPAPDLVYYDFYAPRSCPELWSLTAFASLRKSIGSAQLYTYSASTAVRVALLLSGFYVGYGQETAVKLETTIAVSDLKHLKKPLGEAWLEHLKRSGSPLPLGSTNRLSRDEVIARITDLPQFSR